MKSAAPVRLSTRFLASLLVYLPFFLWSMIGAGWTLWRHPFSRWFLGGYLLIIIHALVFGKSVGGATVMAGIAECHMMAAFALHTWLHLPIWTLSVFFCASIALLILVRVRAASG